MYRRQRYGLYKHWDIILIDIILFQISFIMAYMIRHGLRFPYKNSDYNTIAVMLVLTDLCLAILGKGYNRILKRGYYKELRACIKRTSIIIAIIVLYMFIVKRSDIYSREVILTMWYLDICLGFLVRIIWKLCLRYRRRKAKLRAARSVLLMTSKAAAENIIENFNKRQYSDFYISGIVTSDSRDIGEYIRGVPIVSDFCDMYEYVKTNVIDEIFISFDNKGLPAEWVVEKFLEAGITVHTNISDFQIPACQNIVETFGGYMVITSSINMATMKDMIVKRIFDLAVSIIGIAVMIAATVIVAPIIFIQSPGAIFFSQIRVGRNGRKFKIYKFRTMYLDAEERKQELTDQNRIKDGMMFKVENDPRIFPFGHIMRKFSIDEIPQFINVLKGDMSLVGTRPPTVDEYEKYDLVHKSRLATKPGITGMWQVKGRSSILDFEDVVKLDNEYIRNWSIGLDLHIIFETFKVVIFGKGAM